MSHLLLTYTEINLIIPIIAFEFNVKNFLEMITPKNIKYFFRFKFHLSVFLNFWSELGLRIRKNIFLTIDPYARLFVSPQILVNSIAPERYELQTSNLVCTSAVGRTGNKQLRKNTPDRKTRSSKCNKDVEKNKSPGKNNCLNIEEKRKKVCRLSTYFSMNICYSEKYPKIWKCHFIVQEERSEGMKKYRLISLSSIQYKRFSTMTKRDSQMSWSSINPQNCDASGKATTEQIQIEKGLEYKIPLYLVFVDYYIIAYIPRD